MHRGDKGPSWLEPVACAAVTVAYLIPLLLTRYFPGLDLPWHAAIVEVIHRHDASAVHRDFLGFYRVEQTFSSYLTLYVAVDLLAFVCRDVVVAMQVVIAAYVAGFVWGARRLIRAFGGHGLLAVLAAPAAYSVTMEYGFLAYALTYPLTFYLWALVQELFAGKWSRWRYAQIALLSTLIAITHPFAALIAVAGAAVLLVPQLYRERHAALGGAVCVLAGLVPVVITVIALASSTDPHGEQSALAARAGVWDKLTTHEFTPLLESLAAAPLRLLGFVPAPTSFLLVAGGLIAAVIARHLGGVPGRDRPTQLALWSLLALLVCAYLITPFTFQWPKRWFAVQPRLLPLLWVVGLVVLRTSARTPRANVIALPALVVAAAAWALLVVTAWLPFARETSDFRAVADRSAAEVRTLALIEHEPVRDRQPASPWRHFGAYLVVDHAGFVSHLPMSRARAGNAGVLVPVKRATDSPPLPKQPAQGYPRTFRWELHAEGWDQFLIRDRDPAEPWDYFGDHADQVVLVAKQGRWRLYRRK